MEQENEVDVEKDEGDTQEHETSEEKEESDLDDIDEDSEQSRFSVSEAGSARQSFNISDDQPDGGMSREVRSLSKGQAINHFQMLNLLRKIMLATTNKTEKLTTVKIEPAAEDVGNDGESHSESDERETVANNEEVFEPPTPGEEKTNEVENEA